MARVPSARTVTPDDARLAVDAHHPALLRGQCFGPGGSGLGTVCGFQRSGAAGLGTLGGGLGLGRVGGAAGRACGGALGSGGGRAGAFQHPGHELLIQRGRQLLGAAVGGQDGVGVIAAGAGVGGVVFAADGCQHPLPAGAAGEPPVHRHPAFAVQRHRGQQGAVGAPQVERRAAARPGFGQNEVQLVHPGGVLRAQVQAVGPGKELGAAALLLCDLDLHKNLPFCFFLDCTGGAVFYPVRTFFQNISVLRHFAGEHFSGEIRTVFFG